jgi:dTDP-4-amino-4,6-dideoxygalactose transaminase
MITNLKPLLAPASIRLHEGLRQLNDGGLRVLLLVDPQGRLVRTVTDGDIRRFILSGGSLDDSLESLPPISPKTVSKETQASDALRIMREAAIDHLPVVDSDDCPIGLHIRRALDDQILLSTPHLGDHERDFVEQAFSTNWIAPLGPNVDAFEKDVASYAGIGHAAALSSGTAAIHLALRLLNVGPGDVVFCSSLTFVASVNPVLYQSAKPVFIDSEPGTWNMSPQALGCAFDDARKSGELPKAVIVVNLYGQSADMDPIRALCDQHGVPIIEDAAESLGATYKGKASGTLGRVGIYSFNGNKIITTSGGGMLVSQDEELVSKARFLSTQARDRAGHYEHSELGYNYRMSNILAGVGRGQMRVLEQRVAARRAVFDRYVAGLTDCEAVQWMPEADFGLSTRWLTAGLLDPDATSVTPIGVIDALAQEQIEARRVWKPMHRQPLYRGSPYYSHAPDMSVSDQIFERGICLPSGSNMSVDQQDRVIYAVRDCLGKA